MTELVAVVIVAALAIGWFFIKRSLDKKSRDSEANFLATWQQYTVLHVAVKFAAEDRLTETFGEDWENKLGRWVLDNNILAYSLAERVERLKRVQNKDDKISECFGHVAAYRTLRKWAEEVGRIDDFDRWVENCIEELNKAQG